MVDWPHAPPHRFSDAGVYFITAGTYRKEHFFRQPAALDELQERLFEVAQEQGCSLQAWALLTNHYHLVVAADEGERVRTLIKQFHVESALDLNRRDGTKGRRVWYQSWDLLLTFERSWLVRLRYTHENAVHHGLVENAERYRWCSARWFADNALRSFVETVRRVKIDRVHVFDEF